MCVYVCVCPFSSIPGYLCGESLPCVNTQRWRFKSESRRQCFLTLWELPAYISYVRAEGTHITCVHLELHPFLFLTF